MNDSIVNRIVFLWLIRDIDPEYYLDNKLGIEKEDLYASVDRQTMEAAHEKYLRTPIKELRELIRSNGYSKQITDIDK